MTTLKWSLILLMAGSISNATAQSGNFQFSNLFSPAACPKETSVSMWTNCVGIDVNRPAIKAKYSSDIFTEYEGKWVEGEPNGKGRMYSKKNDNGGYTEFVGDFKSGKPLYGCTGPVSTNDSSVQTEYKITAERLLYFSPSGIYWEGITSASVNGSEVTINLSRFNYSPEYESLVEKRDTWKVYKPSGGRIIGNTLLLGIPILLDPINRGVEMLGCSEDPESTYERRRDEPATPKIRTGNGQWVKADPKWVWPSNSANYNSPASSYDIYVEGIGTSFKAVISITNGRGIFRVGEDRIASLSLDSTINLRIKCLSCKSRAEETSAILPSGGEQLAQEIIIEADFRSATEQLAQIKERQEEDARTKTLEEKRIAREGDGSEDDLACQKRKLKPSTSPYLNCRTSLVDKREKDLAAIYAAEEKKRILENEREARRVAAEQAIEERKKKEEAARVARIPQPLQNEFTGDGRLSLDGSKKKCVDLGFKPSTEGFGKCVLQLSK